VARTRVIRIVVLPLLAALAACAGGSDQSDLAKHANAICTTYSQAVDKLKAPTTMPETAAYAAKARALFATSTRKLHALDPHPADAADYHEWLALVDRALRRVAALERAARAGDEAKINALGDATSKARVKSDALARKLGFRACAAAG
jgi:Tfp pilus assembly protein PilP